ncbi:hypothetical protein NFI96_001687, partial [Prochilodus magdalenae]
MENNQCKVDNIKSDKLYVVVGCENVDNKCLPVHFHGQVKKTEPDKSREHKEAGLILSPNQLTWGCGREEESTSTGNLFGQSLSLWMKLSVLLMFLLALTPSSGIRCDKAYNNQNGYKDFSEKHILSEDFPINPIGKDLNDIFEKYLQEHNICGREALQTFFDRSNTDQHGETKLPTVEGICNGKGFEHGNNGNLCISEQKFPVYMVK